MRIVVIGAGVLGSLYGARLAAAGHSVTVVARGNRLKELRRGPMLILNDEDGVTSAVTVEAVSKLEPDDDHDLALVMVRADQIDKLLPELKVNRGVKVFLFMHNRAAGNSHLAEAVGPDRFLLGFPGAGGWRDGATVRYRLIPAQPTTLGEPDGRLSPRLRQIAKIFEEAGFTVALSRRMDDWLKTHAMLVTAIAGAIYLANGSTITLSQSAASVRRLVQGVRQGFQLLADLIVLSRDQHRENFSTTISLIGDVLQSARTPILVQPEDLGTFDPFGVALVAWNGSFEAANALRAAMPMLKYASDVHIVTVEEPKDHLLPSTAASTYLSRHGITSELHTKSAHEVAVDDVILTSAEIVDAKYLVMGGYGHSRAREFLFGGVTRSLLKACPIPLILAG